MEEVWKEGIVGLLFCGWPKFVMHQSLSKRCTYLSWSIQWLGRVGAKVTIVPSGT